MLLGTVRTQIWWAVDRDRCGIGPIGSYLYSIGEQLLFALWSPCSVINHRRSSPAQRVHRAATRVSTQLTSGKLTYTMENGDPIPVQARQLGLSKGSKKERGSERSEVLQLLDSIDRRFRKSLTAD